MGFETSADQPLDQAAIVAGYAPEFKTARDDLSDQLALARHKLTIRDNNDNVPPGVKITRHETPPKTDMTFGAYPDDPAEAIAAHMARRLLEGIDPEGAAAHNTLTMEFSDEPAHMRLTDSPLEEHSPRVKLTWGNVGPDTRSVQALVIYDTGYVEYQSSETARRMKHPADASEFARTNTAPTMSLEEEVRPMELRPAQIEDLEAGKIALTDTVRRYGIV